MGSKYTSINDFFYFGCVHIQAGEQLYNTFNKQIWTERDPSLPKDFPVAIGVLDQGLLGLRDAPKTIGKTVLCHIGDWTIISYWDNSVDKRPGSNAAFIARGIHSFTDMLQHFKIQFPDIYEKLPFQLTLKSAA